MLIKEKVTQGLMRCLGKTDNCEDCPYKAECAEAVGKGPSPLLRDALEVLKEHEPEIVRCEECKYYELKDYWLTFGSVPVLGTSDQPTCTKWGGGDCKTSPDGFCFLAERR